jgi:ATP-dependent RNA helicase DeaD
MSVINRHCKGNKIDFGKIEILRNFSFIEIDQKRSQHMLSDMQNAKFDGFPLSMEQSAPSTGFNPRNEEHPNARGGKSRFGKKIKRSRSK